MAAGVGKSGSPAPKPITGSPAAFMALALASMASVAEGATAVILAEMRAMACHAGRRGQPPRHRSARFAPPRRRPLRLWPVEGPPRDGGLAGRPVRRLDGHQP